ncbi:MAG TPA: alpha/beta fold hydrolase [Dehalococcoidia bacterium]|nr:alpha/beta fold hydrolase [Dehalococcoidia bacterium]
MESQIRYARPSDGVHLAYVSAGEGPPLVMAPCWTMSSCDWKRPDVGGFFERLGEGRRLVTYDCRGVGASQREVDDISLDALEGDLLAVVDHLGLERFDLCGFLAGATVCVAFAARHPERVSRLVLWNLYSSGKEWMSRDAVDGLLGLVRGNWALATRTMAELVYPDGPLEAQEWVSTALRESLTPEIAAKYVEFRSSVDVTEYLSRVQAPTLVLHRKGTSDVPFRPEEQAAAAAAAMPDGRFVGHEAGPSSPYLEHEGYMHLVREFLEDGKREEGLPEGLTPRQIEVLRLVAAGKSNRQIAEKLSISINTADRHVSNILTKIGAINRTEAASFAVRSGIA